MIRGQESHFPLSENQVVAGVSNNTPDEHTVCNAEADDPAECLESADKSPTCSQLKFSQHSPLPKKGMSNKMMSTSSF